ncbi:hypothetical protein IQ243_03180 [Nostocales cyanobacterium LEGE 11386]|jgi:hypothetical protein|nr:hypothetical protein [Nostocales cyanobacterium LEGE 11386]
MQKIKELTFVIIVVLLIGGSLGLAYIDKDYRSVFADIVKLSLGGYVGWVTSARQNDQNTKK